VALKHVGKIILKTNKKNKIMNALEKKFYDSILNVEEVEKIENVVKAMVVNNLTSTATDLPLSAAQGKILQDTKSAV